MLTSQKLYQIQVGEDGPTHQPIETIPSLRLIPDLTVMRPADGNETAGAYKHFDERMANHKSYEQCIFLWKELSFRCWPRHDLPRYAVERSKNESRPTMMAFSRQAVDNLPNSSIENTLKGFSDQNGFAKCRSHQSGRLKADMK